MHAVSAERGVSALLRDLMLGLWREHEFLDDHDAINLPVALIRLAGSVFQDAGDREPAGQWNAVRHHLARIVDAIERGLGDPDFSADGVARGLGLSKSYLYSVTSQSGTSFGRLLMQHRLERARQMLCDPAMNSRSVTDVAFAVGFRELSHFSRRFHGLFGASPRQYRARVCRGLGLN
jgi:AraC-like DNA-binding protein